MVVPVFRTKILGHAVDSWLPPENDQDIQANDWKLSRMQRRLLSDTPWVRVVDAPTGSGKSFAFQKAVLSGTAGGRRDVLFVAPTRRLTENLAASLQEGLLKETAAAARERGMTDAQHRLAVEQSVLVWNGQQAIPNAPQGRTVWRKRQLSSVAGPFNLGRTVFTVLEIVRDMLFPTRLVAGEGDNRGSVWLSRFKHVVFDEFHTLGPDGLALALVMVAMVQALNRREQARAAVKGREPRYTYLTFLSATPVDVLAFLEKGLGTDPSEKNPSEQSCSPRLVRLPETSQGDGVCLIGEPLIHSNGSDWPSSEGWPTQNRYRALHGDVVLEGVEADGIEALVDDHLEEIVNELRSRRQVVCLWDSKAQLMVEKESIRRSIENAWRAAGETRAPVFLEVHAAADRRRGEGESPGELSKADVVLGTASVEAGVTFRENRLLIMEPGFTLLNLVQRMGRCARGMSNGQPTQGRVVIRLEPEGAWRNDHRSWLAAAVGEMAGMPDAVCIDALLSNLRRAVWPGENDGLYQQDGLDQKAQARAGLFWAGCWLAFERHGRQRSAEWMGEPPPRVRWVKAQLEELETLLRRPRFARRNGGPVSASLLSAAEDAALKAWLARWRQESQALRDIAPALWVLDTEKGSNFWRAQPFDLAWLARFTTVLEDGEACSVDEARALLPSEDWNEGDVFIRLPPGKTLEVLPKERRKGRKAVPPGRNFLMPLAEICWLNNSEAVRKSASQIQKLAETADSKLDRVVPAMRSDGERLVKGLQGLSRLVASTGRAVPDKTNLDTATSAWCESLVI